MNDQQFYRKTDGTDQEQMRDEMARLLAHIEIWASPPPEFPLNGFPVESPLYWHDTEKGWHYLTPLGEKCYARDRALVDHYKQIEDARLSAHFKPQIDAMLGRKPDPLQWLIEQFEDSSDAFGSWFGQLEVDSFTDAFCDPDTFDQHGFPLPDKKPDAIWCVPESETYPTGNTSISLWLQDTEILAFGEISDPVSSLEHFHWYRCPLSLIQGKISETDIPL